VSGKKGLGRGFDSLIPTESFDESFDPTAEQDEKVSRLQLISISKLTPDPDQPRRSFDEEALAEMAASIDAHGILLPLVVTPRGNEYQIVAGERRFRAAKIAGLSEVPAIVRTLSDQHKLELSLIENLQRRDLNPIETATAYLKLRDQFNMTLDEISQRVGGKSISAISNTLRLLRLPESVRQAISDGKLSEGQARPLVNAAPDVIEAVLPKILEEEWSARKIEQFIVEMKRSKHAPKQDAAKQVSTIPFEDDTKRLVSRLSTDVSVRTNAKGAGQIVIRFKNENDFHRIHKLLDSE